MQLFSEHLRELKDLLSADPLNHCFDRTNVVERDAGARARREPGSTRRGAANDGALGSRL